MLSQVIAQFVKSDAAATRTPCESVYYHGASLVCTQRKAPPPELFNLTDKERHATDLGELNTYKCPDNTARHEAGSCSNRCSSALALPGVVPGMRHGGRRKAPPPPIRVCLSGEAKQLSHLPPRSRPPPLKAQPMVLVPTMLERLSFVGDAPQEPDLPLRTLPAFKFVESPPPSSSNENAKTAPVYRSIRRKPVPSFHSDLEDMHLDVAKGWPSPVVANKQPEPIAQMARRRLASLTTAWGGASSNAVGNAATSFGTGGTGAVYASHMYHYVKVREGAGSAHHLRLLPTLSLETIHDAEVLLHQPSLGIACPVDDCDMVFLCPSRQKGQQLSSAEQAYDAEMNLARAREHIERKHPEWLVMYNSAVPREKRIGAIVEDERDGECCGCTVS